MDHRAAGHGAGARGLADVVRQVHWRLRAVDGPHAAEIYGAATLPMPAGGEVFTPFTDLTRAQVLGWLGGLIDMGAEEARALERLADLASPPVVAAPVPWD
jgi:hypothetical protein